ncbi:LPXTG cell wall anchor domain-containing protein [Salinibaculum sp. GCM10025337]|uniref:LPXTG cell wall anchor domain-containing protein n=1 Tax=Salinibaculum sp. GCM10025337 TaxID=3252686 RepID=UPI00360B540D
MAGYGSTKPGDLRSATAITGENSAGFTALTGAAAVLGSALVWLRRRNDED